MYERIKEVEIDQMNEDSKLQILIGIGWRKKEKEIRRIVLSYIKQALKIRKKFISDVVFSFVLVVEYVVAVVKRSRLARIFNLLVYLRTWVCVATYIYTNVLL